MARKRPVDWSSPSVIAGRLRLLGLERYADYLASEHWRDVRRRYRASNRPQRCACGAAGRQLHHLTYERLGAELLTDLELLCEDCHRRTHGILSPKRAVVPPPRRKRKPAAMPAAAPVPRHLRPLTSAVETPKPEKPPVRPKSRPKRGEPKPWEWDARPPKRHDGRRQRRARRR